MTWCYRCCRRVEKFPRSYRFSVGDRLVSSGLDLLVLLVESAYSSDKVRRLEGASHRTNALRYLLRLSKDLHLLSLDSYSFAAEKLEEIGRMVGGWHRSLRRAIFTSGPRSGRGAVCRVEQKAGPGLAVADW